MNAYQSLLDEAVPLVNAERGFIVRYDPDTYTPIQIVAAHDFASALVFQPLESVSKDYQVIQKALPIMARKNQPILTQNYEEEYFSLGYYEGVVPNRPFRSILVVPLSNESCLLWCDFKLSLQAFKPYQPSDLEQLIDLVQRSRL